MSLLRLMISATATGLFFTLAAAGPRTPGPRPFRDLLAAGEPVTIICFGDSITGVYDHSGHRRA